MPVWTLPGAGFFEVHANQVDPDSTKLAISDKQLERALRSITVLNLRGGYPRWTSAAYHGLTDLRLLGGKEISTSKLADMLKSSPGLRIIHCDFWIQTSSRSIASTTVALPELEVLKLEGMSEVSVECFIKLLKPGPEPLQLSLRGNPTSSMLEAFFERSNVQELRIDSRWRTSGPKLLPEAFCLPPQLRVLLMSNWSWVSLMEDEDATPPTQLDTVYMLGCRYENSQRFRKAVAHFSPRRLVLWRCKIGSLDKRKTTRSAFKSALGKNLSESCTLEYLTDEDPNPVPDWTYVDNDM